MSKRKGVSLDEKRSRMLEIFYESKDVFQLKELEKVAPKEKGIVAQSVKEVVQALVDDGLVDSEKIGTSVYFWAFPSKATMIRKTKIEELEKQLRTETAKSKELEKNIEQSRLLQDNTPERESILKNLAHLQTEVARIEKILEKFKEFDPDVIAQEEKDVQKYRDAANVWVDNIFSIKKWIRNKFFIDEEIINKQFNISEDLDYLE